MRRFKAFIGTLSVVALVATLALGVVAPSAFGSNDDGESTPKSGAVGGAGVQATEDVSPAEELTGGPLVIMGIDAEDGGPDDHGPVSVYVSVLQSIMANTANGGSGLLVIGGGKNATDDVTEWWDAVAGGAGIAVTYVNGAANISAQSFAGFQVIGVASGDDDTPDGGLTAAESEALGTRQADVAAFVNGGGGLLVFSQGFADATDSSYAFLGGIGSFTFVTGLGYEFIAPTPEGTAIGITDDLDVSAWHDVYLTYPSFLSVLAWADDPEDEESFDKVAALGGRNVFIGERPTEVVELEPNFTG